MAKKDLRKRLKFLRKNIEDYYLESSELREVLEIVKKYNEQYARIFEFQALTGMRISEVLGLKIETIHI